MRTLLTMMLLICLACGGAAHAESQVNPEIASCSEIKDDATHTQAEICSAYLPCKMVFAMQATCTGAKRFLTRLGNRIGDGVDTLFGKRKTATPDAVFEAAVPETAVSAGQSSDWKALANPVSTTVAKAGSTILPGKDLRGEWVFVGDVRRGEPNGAGMQVLANGEIKRGTFKDGQLDGAAEVVRIDGQRKVGTYQAGFRTGYGIDVEADGTQARGNWEADARNGKTEVTAPDGSRFSGIYKNGVKIEGVLYRADGSKVESGSYADGVLAVGQRYDSQGTFLAEVNLPRDRFIAARTALPAPVTPAMLAPGAADAHLNIMSAGELFARADELRESGNVAGAKQAMRELVTRFPDHELGQMAATQLAQGWSGATARASTTDKPAAGGSGGANGASQCKAALQALDQKQQAVLARPHPPGAVPAMQLAMGMMQQYLQELDRSCAGDPQVATLRADMERSYKGAETSCNQMASIVCKPTFD